MVDVSICGNPGKTVLAAVFRALPPEKVAVHLGFFAKAIVDANLWLVIVVQVGRVGDVVITARQVLGSWDIWQGDVLQHSNSGGIDITCRERIVRKFGLRHMIAIAGSGGA